MRKTALAGILVALLAFPAIGLCEDDNPLLGKWTCDYSTDMGVIVDLEFTETEWVAYADTGMDVMKFEGTYEFADNVITLHSGEGDMDATYDPESDQVSVTYEGVQYVFQRFVEAEEEKK